MVLRIYAISPRTEPQGNIVGLILGDNKYVVFSSIAPLSTNDFDLGDVVELRSLSMGPVDSFNKTKNKIIAIAINAISITSEEIKDNFMPSFPTAVP